MTAGKKALIVDDDPTVHTILKFILEKLGFKASSALDSAQGLMMIRQAKPDIITLDIMMPAGGGVTIHDRLKQMKDVSQIPILVYSALPRSELQAKMPESDRLIILTKPSTPDQIIAAVKKLCPVP